MQHNQNKNNWVKTQEKFFTRWVNNMLTSRSVVVKDGELITAFSTGVTLVYLVEQLLGKKATGVVVSPNNRFQKLANCRIALTLLEKDGFPLTIGAENFVDPNRDLIFGFIWKLINHYELSGFKDVELLKWIRETCQTVSRELNINPPITLGTGSIGIAVQSDSRVILLLVEFLARGSVNLASLQSSNQLENLTNGLQLAREKLSIPTLIDPQDILEPNPDELCIVAYLGYFYRYKRIHNSAPTASSPSTNTTTQQQSPTTNNQSNASSVSSNSTQKPSTQVSTTPSSTYSSPSNASQVSSNYSPSNLSTSANNSAASTPQNKHSPFTPNLTGSSSPARLNTASPSQYTTTSSQYSQQSPTASPASSYQNFNSLQSSANSSPASTSNTNRAAAPVVTEDTVRAAVVTATNDNTKPDVEGPIGSAVQLSINLKDNKGGPLVGAQSKFYVHIGTLVCSPPPPHQIQDNKNGAYTISFTPTVAGLYVVFVYFANKLLRPKPFLIRVTQIDNNSNVQISADQTSILDIERELKAALESASRTRSDVEGPPGSEVKFSINMKNPNGTPLKGASSRFTIYIGGPQQLEGGVVDNGDGSYTISFAPYVIGIYVILVKFDGKPLRPQPFIVRVVHNTNKNALTQGGRSGSRPPAIQEKLYLIVTISGCFYLKGKSNTKQPDPYCVVTNKGNRIYRTRTINNTLNPIWNECFVYELTDSNSVLTFTVFDKDMISNDDTIGRVNWQLNSGVAKLDDVRTQNLNLESDCGRLFIVYSVQRNPVPELKDSDNVAFPGHSRFIQPEPSRVAVAAPVTPVANTVPRALPSTVIAPTQPVVTGKKVSGSGKSDSSSSSSSDSSTSDSDDEKKQHKNKPPVVTTTTNTTTTTTTDINANKPRVDVQPISVPPKTLNQSGSGAGGIPLSKFPLNTPTFGASQKQNPPVQHNQSSQLTSSQTAQTEINNNSQAIRSQPAATNEVVYIIITVISAENLRAADVGKNSSTSDPFVTIRIGRTTLKTVVVKKTVNPVWNETLVFEVRGNWKGEQIDGIVYDQDMLSKNEKLGNFVMSGADIGELDSNDPVLSSLDLAGPQASGKVVIVSSVSRTKPRVENGKYGLHSQYHKAQNLPVPSPTTVERNNVNANVNTNRSLTTSTGGGSMNLNASKTNVSSASQGGETIWILVTILNAVNLRAADVGKNSATSDPFVTVKVGKATSKTKVVSKNLNPVWNEGLLFEYKGNWRAEIIEGTVFDQDKFSKNERLGNFSFNVMSEFNNNAMDAEPKYKQVALVGPKAQGTIQFVVSLHQTKPNVSIHQKHYYKQQLPQQTQQQIPPTQPHQTQQQIQPQQVEERGDVDSDSDSSSSSSDDSDDTSKMLVAEMDTRVNVNESMNVDRPAVNVNANTNRTAENVNTNINRPVENVNVNVNRTVENVNMNANRPAVNVNANANRTVENVSMNVNRPAVNVNANTNRTVENVNTNVNRPVENVNVNETVWIIITVLSAENLRAADVGKNSATSDPFVTIRLGKTTNKTKVIKKTTNPVWNETLVFEYKGNYRNESLDGFVYDQDKFSKNDKLGAFELRLNSVGDTGEGVVRSLPLEGPNAQGVIYFVITIQRDKPRLDAGGKFGSHAVHYRTTQPQVAAHSPAAEADTGDDDSSSDSSDDEGDEAKKRTGKSGGFSMFGGHRGLTASTGGAGLTASTAGAGVVVNADVENEAKPKKPLPPTTTTRSVANTSSNDANTPELVYVVITIINAEGLRAADVGKNSSTSDPFVSVRIGKTTQKTKVIKKTVDPVWNESLVFEVRGKWRSEAVDGTVYDQDKFSKNEKLGSFVFTLAELPDLDDDGGVRSMRLSGANAQGVIYFVATVHSGRPKIESSGVYGQHGMYAKSISASSAAPDVDSDSDEDTEIDSNISMSMQNKNQQKQVDVDTDAKIKKPTPPPITPRSPTTPRAAVTASSPSLSASTSGSNDSNIPELVYVVITLVNAEGLRAADVGKNSATSDPFVSVRIGKTTHKTKVIKKTVDPVWNESLVFEVRGKWRSEVVDGTVYDQDKFSKNDKLGGFAFTVGEFGEVDPNLNTIINNGGVRSTRLTGPNAQGVVYFIATVHSGKPKLDSNLYSPHLTLIKQHQQQSPSKPQSVAVSTSDKDASVTVESHAKPVTPAFAITMPKFGSQPSPTLVPSSNTSNSSNSLGSSNSGSGVYWIVVSILYAENLRSSDPYTVVKIGKNSNKTKVVKKTTNPTWNESLMFEVPRNGAWKSETVEGTILDKNNDKLGTFTTSLGSEGVEVDQNDVNVRNAVLTGPNAQGKLYYIITISSERPKLDTNNRYPAHSVHFKTPPPLDQSNNDPDFHYDENMQISISKPPSNLPTNTDSIEVGAFDVDMEDSKVTKGNFLILTVLSGTNLPAADSNGFSDPYIILRYKKITKRTRIIVKNLNPVWNDTFLFLLPSKGDDWKRDEIEFKVLDYDLIGKPDSIGMYVFSLSLIKDLNPNQVKAFNVDLDQGQGKIQFVASLLNEKPLPGTFGLHNMYLKDPNVTSETKIGISISSDSKNNNNNDDDSSSSSSSSDSEDKEPKTPKSQSNNNNNKNNNSNSDSQKPVDDDVTANMTGVLSDDGSFEMRRTSVMIGSRDDPRKTIEVDAWIGEKTFWNRKKESKYIVTVSNPILTDQGDKLRFQLTVENKSNIKNKFFFVWMYVLGKGKKGKIGGKKMKLPGTESNSTASQEVEVKIPLEEYSDASTFVLVVQPKFRGITHADMTMRIDITEFIIK